MRSALILGLFIVSSANCFNVRVDPLVNIDQGLIRGERASDGDYSSFLGIPYAQVDEEDPFGPAKEAPTLDGIFNAFDDSIKCPQVSRDGNNEGSLDCLRLNIYVPTSATSKNPLPVLIWIHGGGFALGSGAQFHPANLVKAGIIVVTINYRLGPYGFMCLDIPSVPGNQGIKDQYEAIQWVKKNIAAFGGNPYEMTLGGESAGSAAVLYHLYSSNNKLFNKVIVQSDTPQTESMFVNQDTKAAIKIVGHLGLQTEDTEQALTFLKNTPPNLVVAASQELGIQLKPCKEVSFEGVNSIITTDPYSLSNQKKVKSTAVLIGHTSKEHIGVLEEIYGENYLKSDPFYVKIKDNFNLDDDELMQASNFVKHFYMGDDDLTENSISILEDFDSDFAFSHAIQRTVTKLLQEDATVYQFLFSYVGDSGAEGAGHTAINEHLFVDSDANPNDEDQLMINRMTNLWTNFVKYGNPTPSTSDLLPVIWQPASISSRPYLDLDTDLRVEHRVFKDRMAFWDLFYYVYGKFNIFSNTE